jgi:hypothetical protein
MDEGGAASGIKAGAARFKRVQPDLKKNLLNCQNFLILSNTVKLFKPVRQNTERGKYGE